MKSQTISRRRGVKGGAPLRQNNGPDDSKRPKTTKKQRIDLKLRCPVYAHAEKCPHEGMEVGLLACDKDQTFPAIDKLK